MPGAFVPRRMIDRADDGRLPMPPAEIAGNTPWDTHGCSSKLRPVKIQRSGTEKSGTQDKIEGTLKNLAGKIEHGVGRATGDLRLTSKGDLNQREGDLQKKAGEQKKAATRNSVPFLKTPITASALALLLTLTGSLAVAGLAAGCAATSTSDSTGQYVDDSTITTKVKSALLGDDAVKSMEISVQTVKGVVQLSGFVDTADQRSAAEKDAYAVAGVKDVHDSLIVK
jgi:osmotically-inducible protein OsmY